MKRVLIATLLIIISLTFVFKEKDKIEVSDFSTTSAPLYFGGWVSNRYSMSLPYKESTTSTTTLYRNFTIETHARLNDEYSIVNNSDVAGGQILYVNRNLEVVEVSNQEKYAEFFLTVLNVDEQITYTIDYDHFQNSITYNEGASSIANVNYYAKPYFDLTYQNGSTDRITLTSQYMPHCYQSGGGINEYLMTITNKPSFSGASLRVSVTFLRTSTYTGGVVNYTNGVFGDYLQEPMINVNDVEAPVIANSEINLYAGTQFSRNEIINYVGIYDNVSALRDLLIEINGFQEYLLIYDLVGESTILEMEVWDEAQNVSTKTVTINIVEEEADEGPVSPITNITQIINQEGGGGDGGGSSVFETKIAEFQQKNKVLLFSLGATFSILLILIFVTLIIRKIKKVRF